MQHAPPVAFTVGGGWPWRLSQTLLYAAASAAVSVWALQRWGASPWWALVPVSKVAVLAWVLLRPKPARLAWDGTQWQYCMSSSSPALSGQVQVMLDAPGLLLLLWRASGASDGGPRRAWLALSRRDAGAEWPAARVALFQFPPQAPVSGLPRA